MHLSIKPEGGTIHHFIGHYLPLHKPIDGDNLINPLLHFRALLNWTRAGALPSSATTIINGSVLSSPSRVSTHFVLYPTNVRGKIARTLTPLAAPNFGRRILPGARWSNKWLNLKTMLNLLYQFELEVGIPCWGVMRSFSPTNQTQWRWRYQRQQHRCWIWCSFRLWRWVDGWIEGGSL